MRTIEVTEVGGEFKPPAATKLGDRKAKGAPAYFNGVVWFRGEDDKLWHMPLDRPGDAVNPHGLKCLSTPNPTADGFVYFQGEGDNLMVMQQHTPWLYASLKDGVCKAPPVKPDTHWLCFMGKNAKGELDYLALDLNKREEPMGFNHVTNRVLKTMTDISAGWINGKPGIVYVVDYTLTLANGQLEKTKTLMKVQFLDPGLWVYDPPIGIDASDTPPYSG